MRKLVFDGYSYLVPITLEDLRIGLNVYLNADGYYLPCEVVGFDHDINKLIVVRFLHFTQVAYPANRLFVVRYL